MLISRNFVGSLAVAGLFISSGAWAFDLPNDTIPESGSPYFWNNVSIDMNDAGSKNGEARLKITGRGDFTFVNGSSIFNGEKIIYKFLAFYNDLGELQSGTVQIKGGIPSLGIDKGTLLMTADIDEWNLHDDPHLWAFGTTNIVCSPLLLITCTQNESIYVSLLGNGGFDGNFSNGRFLTSGFAVTTVPVPAAAWLFGSALGLLGWVRSRNRRSTRVAV
jgi:hypothetical protein